MLIKKVEIERFRCVRQDSLDCDSLTALVGRNGAGKSCFLHALRLFYAVAPSVTEEDFYNRDTAEPIQIRVTFEDLLLEERASFGSYVDGQELIVTKRIWFEEGKATSKIYGASRQCPAFATIREVPGKKDRKAAFNAMVGTATMTGLAPATTADDAEEKMASWESANPAICSLIERETQFIGPPSIGVGALDNFTKFVFVPAVRDVADEAGEGRGSALAELLSLVVNERVENRADLQALRTILKTKYAEIFETGPQTELKDLAGEISRGLTDFHPGSTVDLEWRAGEPPAVGLPSVASTLVEDGFKGEVSRKGHGLQRALVLALLQARARSVSGKGKLGGRQGRVPSSGETTRRESGARRRLETVAD